MSKRCALCKVPARAFCESDQATLCWDCDAKVHGANFLVARHSRTLLCHACQAPTPWRASGARLGHTVSVCDACVTGARGRSRAAAGNGDLHEDDGDDEDADGDEEEDDDDEEDADDEDDGGGGGGGDEDEEGGGDRDGGGGGGGDEDGDNQVVPWSSTTPPPPAASSSSSDDSIGNLRCGYGDAEECGAARMCSSKRAIEDCTDLRSQEKLKYSRFRPNRRPMLAARTRSRDGEATSVDSLRPSKDRRVGRDESVQGPAFLD